MTLQSKKGHTYSTHCEVLVLGVEPEPNLEVELGSVCLVWV